MRSMGSAKKYPQELRRRAVEMVRELEGQWGPGRGAIARVADQLGVHPEALRYWVRSGEPSTHTGSADSTNTGESDRDRIARLERENAELRRSNEILKAASAFFAREMDPRPPS
ncbi:hypothetical protein C1701_23605 [Actinoalloteichus sp. AHMU CJ021]|nr:hypothetical protein C1701_00565 [Actinoalloteichus sp. AHMU CJ021]AUS77108.1 hypothetical protein C1701_00615 [Actinoalloteichus sp. AHMU CJ021]AUS80836.1 hypothetical protein C1701_23605 [Actinoalloteichus sp. AHMU CJ021]